MDSLVEPNAWVFVRLSSGSLKVQQVIPNTTVSLGKYGSFSANHILSRPYNITYELLDRLPGQTSTSLRMVPAAELHADTIAEENPPSAQDTITAEDGVEFQLLNPETGEVLMRSNRETIDDSARQTLTMEEIEELKKEGTGAGMDLIKKLMASHLGIEQKTAFSLAKYKLLKTKKYLRRFTILRMDVPLLAKWMVEEKEASKILELREEMLALVGSWSNVHFSSSPAPNPSGRWLVVDETGGLLVASMAERMGILHPPNPLPESDETDREERHFDPPLATSNTLTLIHSNAQPNLSLLKHFSFNPNDTSLSSPSHPLTTHLSLLSWLQLLSPDQDTTYSTPIPIIPPLELAIMKSNKRGTYWRKLRRYQKLTRIVSTTLAGGFDGLAIASIMDPVSILRPLLPLLRGGAPISIYAPSIEPLTTLADVFSTSRRTAFIQSPPPSFISLSNEEKESWKGDEDFPLNPTLILNTSVQTARLREWQVLPGRTHPVMTGRGGAEGYLFTGVKVVPAEGRVAARGKFAGKKRGVEGVGADEDKEKESKKGKLEHVVVGGGEGEEVDSGEEEEELSDSLLEAVAATVTTAAVASGSSEERMDLS